MFKRLVILTTLLLAAPGTALAVSVTSSNGTGYATLKSWTSAGATFSPVGLRSTTGWWVYIAGKVVYDNAADVSCWDHLTPTINSPTTVNYYDRRCNYVVYTAYRQRGARVHHCRAIRYRPDDCGSW